MDKIVFLEPVFCERIWGGRNLEKFDFSIPQGNIGEAWVIAAHDNVLYLLRKCMISFHY